MSKRILLVGATGYAGRQLANFLLKETDATVILAGRSRAKLDDLQSGLRQQGLAHRLDVLELDATNLDSAALGAFDLLVNATAEGPHNAPLIQACLDHRADWIDMQMTNELLNPPPVLRESIVSAGRCFVIQAGFHPGRSRFWTPMALRSSEVMTLPLTLTLVASVLGVVMCPTSSISFFTRPSPGDSWKTARRNLQTLRDFALQP